MKLTITKFFTTFLNIEKLANIDKKIDELRESTHEHLDGKIDELREGMHKYLEYLGVINQFIINCFYNL